MLLLMAKK